MKNVLSGEFKVIPEGIDWGQFALVLDALGLEVESRKLLEKVDGRDAYAVTVKYPFPNDAERQATRNAGRKRFVLDKLPEDSPFSLDTPVSRFLTWYDAAPRYKGHTIEEGRAALGMSRSTFLRWLKDARATGKLEPATQIRDVWPDKWS